MSASETPAKPISTKLDSRLLDRLDRWIAARDFPTTKRAVIEQALQDFLDGRDAPA